MKFAELLGRVARGRMAIFGLAVAALLTVGQACAQPAHVFFHVETSKNVDAPISGRLLVFMKEGVGDKEVQVSEFHPGDVAVAAMEIHDLKPGAAVELNADQIAYPKPFNEMPKGTYEVQALLDVDHTYNYSERGPEDWISNVVALSAWVPGSTEPVLILDHHPEVDARRAEMMANAKKAATHDVARLEEFESPVLSRFWGKPTFVKAWVILPPGYTDDAKQTWPTAYWTHGFGGNLDYSLVEGLALHKRMTDGKMPPMFWVMLDESLPEGTHEFADSVNDGPWGTALTTEFIPYLEHKYRMDARRNSRLLNGHSSGGWATLQLEVNYPKVFGGTWSTSPDPSDFHDFTGPDLYAAHANMYYKPDGTLRPIFRDHDKVIATMKQMAQMEAVTGDYGGQLASFDWVFSPKGPSGAPEPMFDRVTGDVHPSVVKYWHDHYDLAHIVQSTWAEQGADLKGRIHLYVGTADTFYLDGPAHKFEAVLTKLGGDPHFTYIPDRTHFDLYKVGNDRMGLFDTIGEQMWETARPGEKWAKSSSDAH